MSFAEKINTVLTSDTSLNSYVDGGIHFENLIDNWLAETNNEKWIVYDFNRSAQIDCLGTKDLYCTYSLTVVVIQRSSNDEIDIISDRLIDYLNNYSDSNIVDITFNSDTMSFNQQKGTYNNVLEFNINYLK